MFDIYTCVAKCGILLHQIEKQGESQSQGRGEDQESETYVGSESPTLVLLSHKDRNVSECNSCTANYARTRGSHITDPGVCVQDISVTDTPETKKATHFFSKSPKSFFQKNRRTKDHERHDSCDSSSSDRTVLDPSMYSKATIDIEPPQDMKENGQSQPTVEDYLVVAGKNATPSCSGIPYKASLSSSLSSSPSSLRRMFTTYCSSQIIPGGEDSFQIVSCMGTRKGILPSEMDAEVSVILSPPIFS